MRVSLRNKSSLYYIAEAKCTQPIAVKEGFAWQMKSLSLFKCSGCYQGIILSFTFPGTSISSARLFNVGQLRDGKYLPDATCFPVLNITMQRSCRTG